MMLGETLISVWQQALADGKSTVDLEGKTYSVGRTRAKKLRTVRFDYTDYRLDGIEQNPATTSQWAALARGRGLKQAYAWSYREVEWVAPCAGAWIETEKLAA
jgi:hypothetical protein